MSKKNNQETRRRAHRVALQKEKEDQEKRRIKQERKKKAQEEASARAANAPGIVASLHVAKNATKMKKKGIKLRKHAIIRGIRIKDAESKQKVKELLAAEEALREMDIDSLTVDPNTNNTVEKKKKETTTKFKKKIRGGKKASMALD